MLSAEYDPRSKRLVENFPQAVSHIALINTAYKLLSLGRHSRHEAGSPRAHSAAAFAAPAGAHMRFTLALLLVRLAARFLAFGFGEISFVFPFTLVLGGAGFFQRNGDGLAAALDLAALAAGSAFEFAVLELVLVQIKFQIDYATNIARQRKTTGGVMTANQRFADGASSSLPQLSAAHAASLVGLQIELKRSHLRGELLAHVLLAFFSHRVPGIANRYRHTQKPVIRRGKRGLR